MKNTLILTILLCSFLGKTHAYEVRWLSKTSEVGVQKEGVVKTTSSNAFFVSKVLPIKKIVSIVDVEIKKNKKNKMNSCDENFFPARELNIKKITKTNLDGIYFVRGFWEDGYKYIIASCAETKTGFKSSTAFIRLPFLKRVIKDTYLNQLSFLKEGAINQNDKKTVFNDYIKKLIEIGITSPSYGQGSPFGDADDLTDSFDRTRRSVDRLNETLNRSTETFQTESDDWQVESKKWRKVADSFLKESGSWRSESLDWRKEIESWREESGDWREESGAWRKMIGKTLTPGNFFNIGMATAAGAALGSWGMNILVDGVENGVSALVKLLDRKGRRIANGIEVENLKEALAKVNGSFNSLEEELDRLVMALPIVDFFSKFDKYEDLEKAIYSKLKRKELDLERVTHRNKEEYLRLGEDCTECLEEFDFTEQFEVESEVKKIKNFTELLNINKEMNIEKYCSRINDILNRWFDTELKVKEARVLLLGKKDRATFLEIPYQEFKKAASKLKKGPIKAAAGIAKDAKKALDRGEKAITSEYINRFNKGDFKKENNKCANSWCRAGGLHGLPRDVSCSTYLIDMQKRIIASPSSSEPIRFPAGIQSLVLSDLGFSGRNFGSLSNQEKLRLLTSHQSNVKGQCFRLKMKKFYPEILDSKIRCNSFEFDQVETFNELARCSQDFVKMDAIYIDVLKDVKFIRDKKDQLQNNNVRAGAAMSLLSSLRGESKAMRQEVEAEASSSNRQILEDYKHIDFVKEFCPEVR
jgi:hypothetical protein